MGGLIYVIEFKTRATVTATQLTGVGNVLIKPSHNQEQLEL